MNKIETNLEDCYILEPKRFGDERGYYESVTIEDLEELGFDKIYQVSNSLSGKGIVRGLHFQNNPYCQAKVVRCQRGSVIDVVVDIRKDSKTYGKWTSVLLTPENGRMLYVPRGFAHGFISLEEDTLFEYYVDNKYMPKMESGIQWDDPDLKINWKEIFEKYDIKYPILSDKDKNKIKLVDSKDIFYKKDRRYLVTGINGQLGYDVVKELQARGEKCILAPTREELDITNEEKVVETIKKFQPDVIIHCAAYTAVDKAEINEEEVKSVNVDGTKYITNASIEVGATIMYISTDYIFDGEKIGEYNESDIPNPKSVYGMTKYLGEEEVTRNPQHFITRVSWVFGINGNNFIKTMLKLSENHDILNVVNDQIGSPTYTKDLAKLLVEMSYSDKYGTYHVTNDGYCSWSEFAKYIMEINDRDTVINPVSTEEYKEITKSDQAYRPKNSKLSKEKLIKNNFTTLPTWQDAVKRYCRELKNNNKY